MHTITLHIENLRFEAIIGILEYERTAPQEVLVEAKIEYLYNEVEFLNYAQISQCLTQHIKTTHYDLLESALLGSAAELKKHFQAIRKLHLCIKKPSILAPSIVGASITMCFD